MGRNVLFRHDRVAVLGEHIAGGPDEQRSVRHIACGARRSGELDGPAQVAFVRFRHRSPPSIGFDAR
jgi:hypothetical protein